MSLAILNNFTLTVQVYYSLPVLSKKEAENKVNYNLFCFYINGNIIDLGNELTEGVNNMVTCI